jgi:hypothetical protein
MTQYTVKQGDTLKTIAKSIYDDEAAAEAFAAVNGLRSADDQPSPGAKLKAPSRLYGIASRKKDGDNAVASLGLFTSLAADTTMVFFSPATGKFLVTGPGGTADWQAIVDEANATADMAKRILKTWQDTPPEKLIEEAKSLADDVGRFIKSLKSNPKEAIDELLVVKTHPDWKDMASRIFVRPDVLKSAAGLKADWKEATDQKLAAKLQMLKSAAKEHGLNDDVMKALCTTADIESQWPWDWKYAAQNAGQTAIGSARAQAQSYATDAVSLFVRYISGMGLGNKLDEVTKKIQFSKSGDLTFSLLNGSLSGKWYVPDNAGINLFEIFGVKPLADGAMPTCLLRFQAHADGYMMSEGALSSLVSLPNVNLGGGTSPVGSVPGMSALSTGGATGSASGSGSGKLNALIDWGAAPNTQYRALATVDLAGSAGGGIGGSSKAKIGFKNGNVQCSLNPKFIKGLEYDGTITFDVKSDEAIAMVHHIFASVVHHYFGSMTASSEGFKQLVTSRFQDAIDVIERKASAVTKKLSDLTTWFSNCDITDGNVSAAWYVPEEKGLDFVGLIRKVPLLDNLVRKDVQCWLRFKAEMKGYVIGDGGAAPSGGGSIGSLTAAVQGGASALASVTGKGALAAAVQWRPTSSENWRDLGSVQAAAGMDALGGLGAAAAAAMNYADGKLTCVAPVTSFSGLRSGKSAVVLIQGEGDEAKAFVKHLFSSLDVDLGGIPGMDQLKSLAGDEVSKELEKVKL